MRKLIINKESFSGKDTDKTEFFEIDKCRNRIPCSRLHGSVSC